MNLLRRYCHSRECGNLEENLDLTRSAPAESRPSGLASSKDYHGQVLHVRRDDNFLKQRHTLYFLFFFFLMGSTPHCAFSHNPIPSSSETPRSRNHLSPSFSGEYIIITGAPSLIEWEKFKERPHDKYWGNFVRASRVRIAQLRKEYGTSFPITWFVYRKGYERRQQRQDKTDLISHIQSVRDKYVVKLVWFSSGQELINYLNGGKISTASAQPRNSAKLLGLEYFGHSNRACFMFDYSNEIDSASKAYLHENHLKQIQKNIFVTRPIIKSWGCYTAQSMSRKWRAATGLKMLGATGKTDYSNGYMNGGSLPLVQGRWGG